ncbi:sensor histidine kinase [Pontibacter pamirensis]|uniref:sensor histidine kinase n=1 Tax=Pontibacter pamirensis TaxID=2562824 RepID=UPI001389DAF2|nr:HAMP domain-containing sensor histidine kinase [Pontibacter pamirensis]
MSKHIIIGVIVLMSISLLGVVGLQLYWINDAIKVKQEQFDRSVNTALTKVVEKLETHEAVSVVAHQMASLNKENPTLLPDTAHAPALATEEKHPDTPSKPAKVTKPAKQVLKPQPETPKSTALPSPSKKETVTAHRVTYNNNLQKGEPADFIIISPDGNIKFDNGRVTHPLGRKNLRDNKAEATAQVIAASPIFYSYLDRVKDLPDTIHFRNPVLGKAYSIDSAFQWDKTLEYRKIADSAAILLRTHHTPPLHISVDTLRFLAAEMGNLKHQKRIPITFEPAAISSVNVRNDSIFIYRTDTARQAYFRRGATARSGNAARATVWREATPMRMEAPLKVTAKLQETKVATPTRVTTKGKDGAVKPARLPHARTDASNIEKIEIKKDKLNDVVQKMVVEYAVKDEPLQERLNLHGLQPLLKAELQQQGIQLDFGFWVVAGQTDTVAAQNLSAIRHQALPSYKATLFPNDIFDKPDYLGLYFPDSKAYALKSLWGMLSLSVLFTLVIIATFGTTIHIIYKQKKLSEMKNDFINNMTHEFKTPIATISLATDSIANPKVFENPDKIQYYTRIIREENKRMNAQVENVLQIALLEKNEFKMNLQPIDVHALIIKAIEGIRLQVEQRLGQVNVQLDALQHELLSDEVHLYNVICNLLDNANKYSPASPDIQLVTENVNGGILIAVEDKGIGMSKDTQQRVFEKFYRVPTGNLHNVKGFGLGLSYVKAIVQAHHGDIKLKSELGKGSRFEIFLPLI